MLLMSNLVWILIGLGVVVLVVFIGTKLKDKYYQKGGRISQDCQLESFKVGRLLVWSWQEKGQSELRYVVDGQRGCLAQTSSGFPVGRL